MAAMKKAFPVRRPASSLRLRPVTNPAKRLECLAGRTLLAVARRRRGLDALRCEVVLEHIDTAYVLREVLQRALARHALTELQFGVLVALLARDPEPVAAADLAEYTVVSRAAITDALVHLEKLQLVTKNRDAEDRRVYHVRLTPAGQDVVDRALMDFLGAAGRAARWIEPDLQRNLLSGYERLLRGASVPA